MSETPEIVYENRGGKVWERHADGRRELFAADIIEKLTKLERERNELLQKQAVWEHEVRTLRVELESQQERSIDWFCVAQELKTAVADCLEENRHLADGDDCTLRKLRDAYEKAQSSDRPMIRLTGEMLKTAKFTGPMSTALIFAARYTHTRNTGGTLAVVRALEMVWHHLDDRTRDQILRESHDAEYNLDDWQRLRDFAGKGGVE